MSAGKAYALRLSSPIGDLLLSCDDAGLTGLWMEGARYAPASLPDAGDGRDHPVMTQTRRWLDAYFSGVQPDFTPPLHLSGTPFRMAVWAQLLDIPYGQTTTYASIARRIAAQRGTAHLSAQAVGGAVGHNPVSLIVPCHRVLGTNGSLTGYAGGLEKKAWLLALEHKGSQGVLQPSAP